MNDGNEIRRKALEADGLTGAKIDADWQRLQGSLVRARPRRSGAVWGAAMFWVFCIGSFAWMNNVRVAERVEPRHARAAASHVVHYYYDFSDATLIKNPASPAERLLHWLGIAYFVVAMALTLFLIWRAFRSRRFLIEKRIRETRDKISESRSRSK